MCIVFIDSIVVVSALCMWCVHIADTLWIDCPLVVDWLSLDFELRLIDCCNDCPFGVHLLFIDDVCVAWCLFID